ncbi:hypothetical protein MMC25_006323 [Agyrium rufum]|nr:hypothetical protein [Agyrium rufum]
MTDLIDTSNAIYVIPYYPDGVKYQITTGGHHYIGFVDESTILKYPHIEGELDAVRIESEIFLRLGKHPRIIEFKAKHADGILLEYAPNGSLDNYLRVTEVPVKERLRLAKETAEGVAHAHDINVLICDIHVRNILLDADHHVKLCDFQGRLLNPDGEVVASGGAAENADSFMPREDRNFADIKTDIFALGSTIFYIMAGHRPFPQLDTIDDEVEIENQFKKGHFPFLAECIAGIVIGNCWEGRYETTNDVVKDLEVLELSV